MPDGVGGLCVMKITSPCNVSGVCRGDLPTDVECGSRKVGKKRSKGRRFNPEYDKIWREENESTDSPRKDFLSQNIQ